MSGASWGKDQQYPEAHRAAQKKKRPKKLQGEDKENTTTAFEGWKAVTATQAVWEVS